MTSRDGGAKRLWHLVEPLHATTYFAPEAHAAFEAAGLRGFWRGYFAGRAAPLGPVGPGPVVATFFGFRADFVARALPEVWAAAPPDAAIDARLAGVDAAYRRVFGDDLATLPLAEAAARLRKASDACSPHGRPLFAANAELPWPDEPHLALWHAATLVREHRGDGHVAALTAAGIQPPEAHVLQVAYTGTSPDLLKPHRGWSDEDWAVAADRLRDRGWLAADGSLTETGRSVRDRIETDTNRLAAPPLEALGEDADALLADLEPITAALGAADTIPYPNPMGVPRAF